jgi:predicted transglutaminase-like cysteine proteinase
MAKVVRLAMVCAIASLTAACTSIVPATEASALREGDVVAPPIGYINFCERHSDQCGPAAQLTARQNATRVADRGNRSYYWKAAFDASAPASLMPGGGRATVASFNWNLIFAISPTTQFATANPPRAALPKRQILPSETPFLLAATPDTFKVLEEINSEVNAKVHRETDLAHYGINDYWELPLENGGGAGDCEDYALEKRARLISRGVPMSSLSLALVHTNWGEAHAVLLVRTNHGDYGLDNLSSWIKPWQEMGYTWQAVQSEKNPDLWVSPRQ